MRDDGAASCGLPGRPMSKICASLILRSSARVYDAWITGPSAIGSLYGMPSSHRLAPRRDHLGQHLGRELQIGIAGRDERHEGLAPLAAAAENVVNRGHIEIPDSIERMRAARSNAERIH